MNNFSGINKSGKNRSGEIRGKIPELKKEGALDVIDQELKSGMDKDEMKDKYFAAVAALLPHTSEYVMNKIAENRPGIDFEDKTFHTAFLEVYVALMRKFETEFSYKMIDGLSSLLENVKDKDVAFVDYTEAQKSYMAFTMLDPDTKGSFADLSSIDALYMLAHTAEVVEYFVDADIDLYKKVLNSKSVKMFINSLMINGSSSFEDVMNVLSGSDNYNNHKKVDFIFLKKFFKLVDSELVFDPVVIKLIREAFSDGDKEEVVRHCPAAYAPNALNFIIEHLSTELVFQYGKYLEFVKSKS